MRDFAWRSGRAQVELPVEVATDAGSFPAACKNIGTGGVFVATDHLYDVGTRLAVKLRLPQLQHPISVGAEVRWTRPAETAAGGHPPGMGLRFVNPPAGAVIAIHELLLTKAQQS
jgi:uncharacterized protein (TIGR02266 family)